MKFVLQHRSDILNILQRHGMQEGEVSFVKRRGRIHIIHVASGNHFSYLRKQETRLDPDDRQWKHLQWFRVKTTGNKEADVGDWEQVLKAFNDWLPTL